jgi:hypothetical protein
MAKCNYCQKKGFFLGVDKNKLCNKCSPFVVSDIENRGRIVLESLKLAQTGKTFSTRISRINVLISNLDVLLTYEVKEIPTISPIPSLLLHDIHELRRETITNEINDLFTKSVNQADVAATPTSEYNALSKGFLKVQEILDANNGEDHDFEQLLRLKLLMHKAKIEGYINEAKKAEFKENTKKAIDQYQEALFYIENDDVDDSLQSDLINQVKERLAALTD